MRPLLLAAPLCCAACALPPPVAPGSVLLSNPDIGATEVETAATTSPDCTYRGPGTLPPRRFVIPDNGTRFVEAPIGTDICWRRLIGGAQEEAAHWSSWTITYTYPGRSIDSSL
ncbi:MAG TPA: hypothetical protein VE993_21385 [Stellaceae bacterium]|nr:hypothetical protein [Stellaceae bacterium]